MLLGVFSRKPKLSICMSDCCKSGNDVFLHPTKPHNYNSIPVDFDFPSKIVSFVIIKPKLL